MKKLTLRTVVSKGAVMRYNKTIILSNETRFVKDNFCEI